jgi:hypothetical protein
MKMKNPIPIIIVAFLLSSSVIPAVTYTRMTAGNELSKAQSEIVRLKNKGFEFPRMNDLFKEAKNAFERKDYQKTGELAGQIISLRQQIEYFMRKKNETQIWIGASMGLGLDIEGIQEKFNSAEYEFNMENFEDSVKLINQTSEELIKIYQHEFDNVITQLQDVQKRLSGQGIESIRIKDTIDAARKANTTIDVRRLKLLYDEVESLNKSTGLLLQAKLDVGDLMQKSIPFSKANDTFNEAKLDLELGDTKALEELTNQISVIKKQAIEAKEKIALVNSKIDAAQNLDLTQAKALFSQAQKAFENEDFETAIALLDNANQEIEQKIADSLLFGIVEKNKVRFNIFTFLKKYWWLIILSVVTLAAVFFFSYGMISARVMEKRIHELKKEEGVLTDLMKKAQTDYFIHKKTPRRKYEDLMDKHEKRLIEIKEKIPVLSAKLKERGVHHFLDRKTFKSEHE